MVKRLVDTSFWTDDKVIDLLSPEDRYFMLYLLTNPHTSQAGIYHLPIKIMMFELGYSKEAVMVLLDRFQTKYGMIQYSSKTQEVAILNALKHNIVKGGKPVLDCIDKDLSLVQDSSLIVTVYKHLLTWWNESDRKVDGDIKKLFLQVIQRKEPKEVNDNDISNDNDNDSIVATNRGTIRPTDSASALRRQAKPSKLNRSQAKKSKKQRLSEDTTKVIEYLNKKAGKRFSPKTKSNREKIMDRLKEGFTFEDCKTVIDKKYADWHGVTFQSGALGDNWLTPITLFRPKNFERYLNETSTKDEHDFSNLEAKDDGLPF